MITLPGARQPGFCDGQSRRSFLRMGALGASGLGVGAVTLADVLRADRQDRRPPHRSVVMIYLPGGPTQHETFDPKPDAPGEIRGSYAPIQTELPGISFCELLPRLATRNRRFSIVRTLVGMKNRHESFQCYTGRPGGRSGDREPAGFWPTLGSVASAVLGPSDGKMLPYVDASPAMGYRPYRNRGFHDASAVVSWPGITGQAHIPFTPSGAIQTDLVLQGVSLDRLQARRNLLTSLGQVQQQVEAAGVDAFQQRAFGLLTSSRLAEALDVSREPTKVRERYGAAQKTHGSFGGAPQDPQRLLLARRLVEAGVRVVTVAFGAWDWHANREGSIAFLSKKYLPVFDHSLATFLDDLEERGLLETTAVVVWGEFGRTPRINAKGGRDHWDRTQSVLLAGGGIAPGKVIGRTDRTGGMPDDRPVHVQEVFATLYRVLGIDVNRVKIPDLNGRPRYLVENNRQPIAEL